MHTTSIYIKKGGREIRGIYSDSFDLRDLGTDIKITRASNVEPTRDGRWEADMSPVQLGVILGPFDKRSEALTAEVVWLEERLQSGIYDSLIF